MNTIRLFLFPTEWSATLVLFFFRTPPHGRLPAPMGGFDPLGLLSIHLFHGVSGLTDLCAHGHAREAMGQTDRRARHASSHVRRACIARKNEKNREKSHGPRSK